VKEKVLNNSERQQNEVPAAASAVAQDKVFLCTAPEDKSAVDDELLLVAKKSDNWETMATEKQEQRFNKDEAVNLMVLLHTKSLPVNKMSFYYRLHDYRKLKKGSPDDSKNRGHDHQQECKCSYDRSENTYVRKIDCGLKVWIAYVGSLSQNSSEQEVWTYVYRRIDKCRTQTRLCSGKRFDLVIVAENL
jgi:hypothetical protein